MYSIDSNLDRLSDAVIILGLIYGGFVHFLLGYVIMFLIIMISYIRARAENEVINLKLHSGGYYQASLIFSLYGIIHVIIVQYH